MSRKRSFFQTYEHRAKKSAVTITLPLLLLLMTVSHVIEADAFKCIASSGKITYQGKPCHADQVQQKIPIKPTDPKELAETKARLEAWQIEQKNQEAIKREAERQQREERERSEAVEALKRSAEAQRVQAQAELRQAEALENRNVAPAYPAFYFPYPSRSPYQGRFGSLSTPSGRPIRDPTINRTRENRRR